MFKGSPLDDLIRLAFEEDVGREDITSSLLIGPKQCAKAQIVSKGEGVLCGLFLLEKIFSWENAKVIIKNRFEDGAKIKNSDEVVLLEGNLRDILKAERVALNFLGRLSGIATLTHQFVEAVKGCAVDIMDTRKTTPAFRFLEKYAVKIGGGKNHRFGLYDAILIKENHLIATPGLKNAIHQVRSNLKTKMPIEVEVTTLKEVKEALDAKVDIILLDNFSTENVKEAVLMIQKQALVEVSGGVTLENVKNYAQTGVDRISIGALTHSVTTFDFSLLVRKGD
ncbi:MAG: nicotinate-nucleotide diphosphorylase (carboxylating) [Deltaproteobacteria bacterium RIFCSPLOWO2_12_FULL_38_8]|nr:MAG: nicotinate-nucleotide diphosphorylase (carboxylating) [Deltaproteobacteria bacterium RIFCSPLOWO2_12_FULL_38_8]